MTDEHHRDKALMWLNDHLGAEVNLSLEWDTGLARETLLEVEGQLSHWRQGAGADEVAALDPTGRREDIIGMYRVGGAALDLSWLPDDAVTRDWTPGRLARPMTAGIEHDPKRGVVVEISTGITLTVFEMPP